MKKKKYGKRGPRPKAPRLESHEEALNQSVDGLVMQLVIPQAYPPEFIAETIATQLVELLPRTALLHVALRLLLGAGEIDAANADQVTMRVGALTGMVFDTLNPHEPSFQELMGVFAAALMRVQQVFSAREQEAGAARGPGRVVRRHPMPPGPQTVH